LTGRTGIALAAAGHLLPAGALVAIALVDGVILRRGQSHA
jgi:hypothetical protein